MESIYMMFYNFCATLLGADVAQSASGQIFCKYAAYIIIGVIIYALFWGIRKLVSLFTFWS